jgi:hypothetical protein
MRSFQANRKLPQIMKTLLRTIILVSAFQFFTVSAFSQGSLTPPGSPAPTMKSLDQVRSTGIPINATNTPGDSSNQFIISSPGSYYLTGNIIGVSGKNGIKIANVDISIDLNGFAMIGVSGSLVGITDGGVSGLGEVRIHNGLIRTWGGAGIDISHFANSIISNVIVAFNGGNGMSVGDGCVLRDCLARQNTGTGILTSVHANVFHCSAIGSGSGNGISLGAGSTASDCVANFNHSAGIAADLNCKISHSTAGSNTGVGINCGGNAQVSHCVVSNNGSNGIQVVGGRVSDCAAESNSGIGITGGNIVQVIGCVVQANILGGISPGDHGFVDHCLARQNTNGSSSTQTGIYVTNDSVVRDCTSNDQAPAAGIYVSGSRNRIEANHVAINTVGIQVDGTGNIILRNTASGNTTNYKIAASNRYGAIIDDTATGALAVNGNSAPSSAGSTDPWANFSY